jgi:hypothetical protein
MKRKISEEELALLETLIEKSDLLGYKSTALAEIVVEPLLDGDMGSITLFSPGLENTNRKFLKKVSEIQFKDLDGVLVLASLNIDDKGNLFEIDIWKTDFSKLIKMPKFK